LFLLIYTKYDYKFQPRLAVIKLNSIIIKIERLSNSNRCKVQQASVPSAMKPAPHANDRTVSKPLTIWEEFTFPKEQLQEGPHTYSDPSYVFQSDEKSHLFQHIELNDLVRDLIFSKQQTEIVGSSGICWLKNQEHSYPGRGRKQLPDIMKCRILFVSSVV
jgi:hypothetical protein